MNKKLLITFGILFAIANINIWTMDDGEKNLHLTKQFTQALNDPYLGARHGTEENPCLPLSILVKQDFDFWKNNLWGFIDKDNDVAEARRHQIDQIGLMYNNKQHQKLTKEIFKIIIPISFVAGGLTFLVLYKLYRFIRQS